jgi:glucose-6-phosphate dehydrogenase assembly protein OpcA
MSAAATPDRILRELADLWVSTAHEQEGYGSGVLRACTMTLVVLADDGDDLAAMGETIAALMPEHPARAIVVRLRGADDRPMEARVFSQCWMPFGQRRQICCEQVEISVSDAGLDELPVFVMPLCVPDLPAVVWCRSPRLVPMAQFGPAARQASRVIVDGAAQPDARRALAQFREQVAGGIRLGDLAWTRLTPRREMLARLFDRTGYRERIPLIRRAEVEYGGETVPVSAWYVAAWLSNTVGAQVSFTRDPAGPVGDVVGLRLAGEGGFDLYLRSPGDAMLVESGGVRDRIALPSAGEYSLMREELRIVQADPVFEATLSTAARLALSS